MIESRVAIVTGGARGIGRAIAEYLARDGLGVAIWDLNEDGAREVADGIRSHGGLARQARVDVSDVAQVRAATADVHDDWGRIDVLVNNAGWDRPSLFLDTTEEHWDKVIAVNYRAVLATSYVLAPLLIEAGDGRIINIASDTAKIGYPLEAVYSGAKGAVISFTRALARELASSGVTVNAICPGATDTPLLREEQETFEKNPDLMRFFPDGFIESAVKAIPLGRLGTPEDLANAVSFFVRPASGFITGQVLSVDGGQTMY
jgi:2-hydroxycyclohexanecarboxyl-CoA dehydrogenase